MEEIKYRVVYKETKNAPNKVISNISFEEMLKYFERKDVCYSIKVYEFRNGDAWEQTVDIKEGKTVRKQKIKKPNCTYQRHFSLDEMLNKALNANSKRKENPAELLWDIITGEDVLKPKISLVRKDDDDD
ncbi:hypothetical protein AAGG74_17825 [Bacillus mexicanus]|uniref:hypothetical protein n=1 Tax=Bacillus mexicanus TaxID=2834415 RepID=UPI003D1BC0E0